VWGGFELMAREGDVRWASMQGTWTKLTETKPVRTVLSSEVVEIHVFVFAFLVVVDDDWIESVRGSWSWGIAVVHCGSCVLKTTERVKCQVERRDIERMGSPAVDIIK
jgi:hypothetical protein